MDLDDPKVLTKILDPNEIQEIPEQLQEKLNVYINDLVDKYCKEKSAAYRLAEYEDKVEDWENKIRDFEQKVKNDEQVIVELRLQLDKVTEERSKLLELGANHEQEVTALRKEKNSVIEEHNSLLKVLERKHYEESLMKSDLQTYQQQLQNIIEKKNEALARIDDIESKEITFQMKERRFEQESNLMRTEIQMLKNDLSRNITEMQNLSREKSLNSMHLETRLNDKSNEIKMLQQQCVNYNKKIEELNENIDQLNKKMAEDRKALEFSIEQHKKELDMQSKLINLYKANIDQKNLECVEIDNALANLKQMLSESSIQYSKLEMEHKELINKFEKSSEDQNTVIDSLKQELVHANELIKELQDETVENAIAKLAPTAAVTSRLMRTDMSLTELYSQYVKSVEQLEELKLENSKLNLSMKNILEEIGEKAPVIQQLEDNCLSLHDANKSLSQQHDDLLKNKQILEKQLEATQQNLSYVERERDRLKKATEDMSRQIASLLIETQQYHAGNTSKYVSAHHTSPIKSSDDAISKQLVTFKSVNELQENNLKLLLLVRDLSGKLEEIEKETSKYNLSEMNEQLKNYEAEIEELHKTIEQQNEALKVITEKAERYKEMYFGQEKTDDKENIEIIDLESSPCNKSRNATNQSLSDVPKNEDNNDPIALRRIHSLEQQVADANEKYNSLKEQYEYYRGEKQNNDKLMQEQFDAMRKEVRQLTSDNCRVLNTCEYQEKQIKSLSSRILTYKDEISALESRTKDYEKTNISHEQTIKVLKDELLLLQRQTAYAESEVNNLRHENRMIKEATNRLEAEKEAFHRQDQQQALLLNNLEFIKTNLERSAAEGRIRLEQSLDEAVRELSAQRRHFQEEEECFKERINDLQRQTDTAKKQLDEEKQQADKIRDELKIMHAELASKTKQIDELSKKLQESLSPSVDDNPITLANKRIREFEHKLQEANLVIESLKNDLAKAREHGDQFYKMSQNAESEIKNLHDIHTAYKSSTEAKIAALKQSEDNLKTRISELESHIMLSNVTEMSKNLNQTDQLKQTQEELKLTLQKLTEANNQLRALRAEKSALAETLNETEKKYANEMMLHSADIQELTKLKTTYTKMQDQIKEISNTEEAAKSAYEGLKSAHDESLRLLQNEKEEYEKRVEDLTTLNASLHDQIDALTSKLFTLSQTTPNQSLNESVTNTSSATDLSQSKFDDEKINDQLWQITKILRKEKDLAVAKLDIVKAESARIKSEHTILQKKVDELTACLNQERIKVDADIMSASKHQEILRKIDTIDAITDSNRVLRDERNELSIRITEFKERINSIEGELFPLKAQNNELTSKVEELSLENTSLRNEAVKWRQRANALVEKSNKNPEEFKRLQLERENLAKMLTTEKELRKKSIDEINVLRTRLDTELPAVTKQLQALGEERKKSSDEIAQAKQNNARMSIELLDAKNKLYQAEADLGKANDDIHSQEKQLQDLKNKELQLRKIAKRYKDSYTELARKSKTSENVDINELVEDNANNMTEVEALRSHIESLNQIVASSKLEAEQLKKENSDLKLNADANEQSKLLREARIKIVSLTEAKNQYMQENANYQRLMQAQSTNDMNTNIAAMKASYDEKISNLEKELQEQITLSKDTLIRLTRENESLHIRISQLNRQLGLQQSAKPSTSSVVITEKGGISDPSPRTANVKPMSGSATVQQSATVTPWRGGETPLASIRPISVQNSRTAAILPTSQQTSAGSSSSTSSSTSSSASTSVPTGSSSTSTGGNTALVPPQQQVHTTGSTSLVESIASSSPTSSHTDYMPSTSTAAVAVATIPPMGTASASAAAESSQEAESVQQPQQNDAQLYVSGGQTQAVALVSPRVEGSSSSTTTNQQNTTSSNVQQPQDSSNQQPSTSGSSGTSSSTVVSSHSRHAPSSSSVTTTQAGCSSIGHKRPRDHDGDSTNTNDGSEKLAKLAKRSRISMHGGESSTVLVGDSGIDLDQMPTSSQRDQEDDIVVVDSEDDDGIAEGDDDEAMDGGDAEQEESYEDSFEQDQEIDENECPEEVREDMQGEIEDQDNNEVDIDERVEQQAQCTSGSRTDNQSSSADATATIGGTVTSEQDNNQQSQAISSGSGDPNATNIPQVAAVAGPWKQATSSSTTITTARRPDNSTEIVSSPQISVEEVNVQIAVQEAAINEGTEQKTEDTATSEVPKNIDSKDETSAQETMEADEDFSEQTAGTREASEPLEGESQEQQNSNASQSAIQDNQLSQIEGTAEDNEATDGVSSEGEKQTVEGVEEEGREAEATTSLTMNTRSKTSRGGGNLRKSTRGPNRGSSRPTPIVWQETPGNSRAMHNLRNQDTPTQQIIPNRGFNTQRGPRGRRAIRRIAGNYPNIRFP